MALTTAQRLALLEKRADSVDQAIIGAGGMLQTYLNNQRQIRGLVPYGVADLVAPTLGALTLTRASNTTVNISMVAADAGSGLRNFIVQRSADGATGWAEVYRAAGSSTVNTVPSAGVWYYRFAADDNANNVSAFSAPQSVNTVLGTTYFGATLPTLPQLTVDTTFPTVTGVQWTVTNTASNSAAGTGAGNRTGCGLQYALDNCAGGDEIVITHGLTFVGAFNFPNKAGSSYVLVRTDVAAGAGIPALGTRAAPANAANMPKLKADNAGNPSMTFANGSHHWRFVGLEVTTDPAVTNYGLISIQGNTLTLANIPHHIIFDRCYVHGDPLAECFRGWNSSGKYIGVIDCYVSDFCSKTGAFGGAGQDTQGYLGVAGYGPVLLKNNYIDATGENIMFGGSNCVDTTGASIASDIEIVGNLLTKPAYMDDEAKYVCKNLLEMKLGKRVWIHGNKLDRLHVGGQLGFAVTMTVRDQHDTIGQPYFPGAEVSDITFEDNRVSDVLCFLSMFGSDDGNGVAPGNLEYDQVRTKPTSRVLFRNVLVEYESNLNAAGVTRLQFLLRGVGTQPGNGFPVRPSGQDWIFDHVTFINRNGEAVPTSSQLIDNDGGANKAQRLVMVNCIFGGTTYGYPTSGNGNLNEALSEAWNASNVSNNAYIDIASIGYNVSTYPAGNFFPANIAAVQFSNYAGGNYALGAGSPYKAAGLSAPGVPSGKDLGCDISRIPA